MADSQSAVTEAQGALRDALGGLAGVGLLIDQAENALFPPATLRECKRSLRTLQECVETSISDLEN